MQKSQRDSVLSRLSGGDRQDLRRVLAEIQAAATESAESAESAETAGSASPGGRITARELLKTWGDQLPENLISALETIMVRDETGPGIGEDAIDFSLKRLGTDERVRLSDFQGKRPVALAFGSYT